MGEWPAVCHRKYKHGCSIFLKKLQVQSHIIPQSPIDLSRTPVEFDTLTEGRKVSFTRVDNNSDNFSSDEDWKNVRVQPGDVKIISKREVRLFMRTNVFIVIFIRFLSLF
jgi:hypothetical protein